MNEVLCKPGLEPVRPVLKVHNLSSDLPESYLEQAIRQIGGTPGLHAIRDFSILEAMNDRRFRSDRLRPRPAPRFLIHGKAVSTPGNLTTIISQAKAGKTAFVGALISAAICAEQQITDRDNLGVSAAAPEGKILLHIDTEQSLADHDEVILRALRRAGVEKEPAFLWSYGLNGLCVGELLDTILELINEASRARGLYAIILDGCADMATDVNDAAECNEIVSNLMATAIQTDCPIVAVMHENPGADNGKMRGHLGSQLERKAESNLRLRKSDETTVVYSEKMRRAPILEKDGPRFVWSSVEEMHVSTGTVGEARDDAKRAELRELACEVFEGRPSLKFTDMTVGIIKARDCTKRTAERKLDAMLKAKVITKQGFGLYSPTTDNQPTNEPT